MMAMNGSCGKRLFVFHRVRLLLWPMQTKHAPIARSVRSRGARTGGSRGIGLAIAEAAPRRPAPASSITGPRPAHLDAARGQLSRSRRAAGPARARTPAPTCGEQNEAAGGRCGGDRTASAGSTSSSTTPASDSSRNVADMDVAAWHRCDRHEPQRRVLLLPRRHPAHAAARRRLDRQHQQPRRRRTRSQSGAAYCASKAGLNAFSEALMQEVRHDNIRVSYVMPGSVATGFGARYARRTGRRLEARAGRRGAGRRRSDCASRAKPAEPRRAAAVEAAEALTP